jgi:hypothetical protein
MFKRPGWQATAAIVFVAAGFVVMGLAWNGAASIDFAQGQIPYLISGGFVGLGLIIIGVGLMLFETGRRAGTKADRRISEIYDALSKISVSSNGQQPARQPAAGEVVIGASTYHRPTCRLVAGKEEVTYATVEAAAEQGLAPCRVCNPAAVPAGG